MEVGSAVGQGAMRAAEADAFEEHRPRLTAIAYRMLGEVQEAEDAVQDAFLRWERADRAAIEAPGPWLAKAVTNLCLTRLASARARRESYPGTWLPEPVSAGAAALGPLETVQQRESVSLALLTLMESLTPAERAVFVLREAFGYPHREIAGVLEIGEAASRQLHRRARRRLGTAERRFEPGTERWRNLVERFLDAATRGDVAALEELLAADVTAWADGGGKATAARRPVTGRERVLRFVLGLARDIADYEIAIEDVNGSPALVFWRDGALYSVFAPDVADGRVTALHIVRNPDKLARAGRVLRRPSAR
ncbi:RNA polymerase sigma-70 factor [Spirillospora sp. NPDC029432]|uniref:RNA polymerase sigma-70 factor n=1 Tax=Spirillospora sp. NPDC029432 TaxID=3154599 RepID=UPI00345254DE